MQQALYKLKVYLCVYDYIYIYISECVCKRIMKTETTYMIERKKGYMGRFGGMKERNMMKL